jgi:hypothetical protein
MIGDRRSTVSADMTCSPVNSVRGGVHFASFHDEDSGEQTCLYLYSHRAIDFEIDQRIRLDPERRHRHEQTRLRFHAQLSARAGIVSYDTELTKQTAETAS